MKTPPIENIKCAGYQKFNLKPFGKFRFGDFNKNYKSPYTLEQHKLSYDSRTSLQLLPSTLIKIHKMMKQHKTDILIDGTNFYTTMNEYIVMVNHPKLIDFIAKYCVRDNYEGTFVIKDTLKLTEKTFDCESNTDFHN